MIRFRLLFFLVPYLLSGPFTYAQLHKFSGWFQTQNEFQLNKKLSLQIGNQFRTDNHWKNAEILETNTGLTYDVTSNMSVAGGYSFIENWTTFKGIHDNIVEHRLWSQFSKEYGGPRLEFKQRIRIEERILPIIGLQQEKFIRKGNDLSTRIRYQLKWTRNFPNKPGSELGLYTVFNNEIFLNASGFSFVNNKLLDQVRAFAGVGYRFSDHLEIEPGYLFQYVWGKNSNRTQNSVVQISFNMDL